MTDARIERKHDTLTVFDPDGTVTQWRRVQITLPLILHTAEAEETKPMQIVPLSQRDPKWANIPLGTGALTIGGAGCLLVAACMVHNAFGGDLTPAELNACLIATGGYFDGNLFVWDSMRWLSRLTLERLVSGPLTPATMDDIRDLLWNKEAGIICLIDSRPDMEGVQDHYVVLTDVLESGTAYYTDPFDGTENHMMRDPERDILAYAAYERICY